MKTFSKYLVTVQLVLSAVTTFAQFQGAVYLPDTSFKVYANSAEKSVAFCGGFNNPQFAVADLNHDGKNDLVVFEKMGEQILTFLNKGTANNPDYRYAPKYALNFPNVTSYLKLEDYNCDGIADLFHRGGTGFDVYKGYYNAYNELCFTHYKPLFHTWSSGWINAYCDPGDIPGIVDVDGDGDLDFVAFYINGSHLQWYRNRRVEDGLPCDSIRIELKDKCWGRVAQTFVMTQSINVPCTGVFPVVDNGSYEADLNSHKTTLHSGNNLCFLDYDGDGDLDYLNGGVSYPYIQFLKNGKIETSAAIDTITSQDTTWQSNGVIYNKSLFPGAFYFDYDMDGKKDILLSPSATADADNYRCISWYKNTGTVSSPVFTYKGDSLLSNQTIDLGSGAYPMIFDYDRDGKPDLFVGGDGYFTGTGNLRSKIVYYRNTSTVGNPSFTLQTENFLNLFASNYKGTYPAVGDLNNDGKEDLIIGHTDGKISFFKDTSTGVNTSPSWVLVTDTLRDVNNTIIDSTQFPAPFIYDLDADGKKDLIIGSKAGWLYYYRNIGNANELKLEHVTSKLGLVKVDKWNLFSGYATPFIGKTDNSGNDYLLLGSNSGNLYRYSGFQNGNYSTPFIQMDTSYSFVDTFQLDYSGVRNVPAITDFDGDGKMEMVVGNILGGIRFYKQSKMVGINTPICYGSVMVEAYPNPSKSFVTINWIPEFNKQQPVFVSLFSITGQLIFAQTFNNTNQAVVNINHLNAGIYQMMVSSGENRTVLKLVKID